MRTMLLPLFLLLFAIDATASSTLCEAYNNLVVQNMIADVHTFGVDLDYKYFTYDSGLYMLAGGMSGTDGMLVVQVYHSDYQLFDGAVVTVYSESFGPESYITNSSGRIEKLLPDGFYDINVTRGGYTSSYHRSVRVGFNLTAYLESMLEQTGMPGLYLEAYPTTLTIVEGHTASFNTSVINSGDFELNNVQLVVSGVDSGWVTYFPSLFTQIDAHTQRQSLVNITVPYGNVATFNITVNASSAFVSNTTSFLVISQKNFSGFSVSFSSLSFYRGESESHTLSINNFGTNDLYDFTIRTNGTSLPSSYFSFNSSNIPIIPAGSTYNVPVQFTIPSDAAYATYNLIFNVSSGGLWNLSSTTVKVEERPAPPPPPPADNRTYDLSVTPSSTSLSITVGNSTSIAVDVKNIGEAAVSGLRVNMTGIDHSWYDVTPSLFAALIPNDTTSFIITFTIPENATTGTYTPIIVASSVQKTVQRAITLEIKEKYVPPVPAAELTLLTTVNTLSVEQGSDYTLDLSVRNTGNLDVHNISLVVSGVTSSWFGITPPMMGLLTPASTGTFTVRITIPQGTSPVFQAGIFEITSEEAPRILESFTLSIIESEEYRRLREALDEFKVALEANRSVLDGTLGWEYYVLAESSYDDAESSFSDGDFSLAWDHLNEAKSYLEQGLAIVMPPTPPLISEAAGLGFLALLTIISVILIILILYMTFGEKEKEHITTVFEPGELVEIEGGKLEKQLRAKPPKAKAGKD